MLTTFSEEMSERARRDLVEIGVEVRTNAKVEAIDAEGVTIAAHKLHARSVFWAAGRAGRASRYRACARNAIAPPASR